MSACILLQVLQLDSARPPYTNVLTSDKCDNQWETCVPAFSRPRYEGWPQSQGQVGQRVMGQWVMGQWVSGSWASGSVGQVGLSPLMCLPHSLLVLSVTLTQSTILCCLSTSPWSTSSAGAWGCTLY